MLGAMATYEQEVALGVADSIEALRVCRSRLFLYSFDDGRQAAISLGNKVEQDLIVIVNELLTDIGGIVIPFTGEDTLESGPQQQIRLVGWQGYDVRKPQNDIWIGREVLERLNSRPSKEGGYSLNAAGTIADIRESCQKTPQPMELPKTGQYFRAAR